MKLKAQLISNCGFYKVADKTCNNEIYESTCINSPIVRNF